MDEEDEVVDDQVTDEVSDQEQAEVDPWADIQEQFTPDDILNLKAQVSTAHERNAEAKRMLDEAKYERERAESLAQGSQLLDRLGQGQGWEQPEDDDPIAALSRQVKGLQETFSQQLGSVQQQNAEFLVDRSLDGALADDKYKTFRELGVLDQVKDGIRRKVFDPAAGVKRPDQLGSFIASELESQRGQYDAVEKAMRARILAQKKSEETSSPPSSSGRSQQVRAKPAESKPVNWSNPKKAQKQANAIIDQILSGN